MTHLPARTGPVDRRGRPGPRVGAVPSAGQALVLAAPATLSHESAAEALGIGYGGPLIPRLTVDRCRSRVRVPGWDVRRADLTPEDLLLLPNGLRVTTPLITTVALARVLPLDQAVAAADSVVRDRLASPSDVRARLAAAGGPGSAAAHAVAGLLDPLSESVLESLLRILLLRNGLVPPSSQYVVRDPASSFAVRVDFCWPRQRLVVEADGQAYHSNRQAFQADRIRDNELERLGWRVLRFTWVDVTSRQDWVVGLVRDCLLPRAA